MGSQMTEHPQGPVGSFFSKQFDFAVTYLPGSKNTKADVLSHIYATVSIPSPSPSYLPQPSWAPSNGLWTIYLWKPSLQSLLHRVPLINQTHSNGLCSLFWSPWHLPDHLAPARPVLQVPPSSSSLETYSSVHYSLPLATTRSGFSY